MIALMCDTDGDECTFIEIYDLESGKVLKVPRIDGAQDRLIFIDSEKENVYFSSNRKDPKFRGLYSFSLKSSKVI